MALKKQADATPPMPSRGIEGATGGRVYRQDLEPGYLFRRGNLPEHLQAQRDQLRPGRWQPRQTFDEEALEELAESLRQHGMINPIQVFQNEFGELEVLGGGRRLAAAERIGMTTVPVQVREVTARQAQEIALVDNLERADLDPVEVGATFERMLAWLGVSEAELARRLGKPRSYIQQRRALAAASPVLREAVQAGQLGVAQARGIVAAAGGIAEVEAEAVKQIAQRVKRGEQVGEGGAKETTTEVYLTKRQKALERLGWSVAASHSIIYSATARPVTATPQMVEAILLEARKTAAVDEATKRARPPLEASHLLQRTGATVHSYSAPPWIGVKLNGETQWLTHEETIDLAAERQPIGEALIKRFARHGYELRPIGEHWSIYRDGRTTQKSSLDYGNAEKLAYQIETGKVKDIPIASWAQAQPCQTPDCPRQGALYVRASYLCQPCAAQARVRGERVKACLQAALRAALAPLAGLPDDCLVTLTACLARMAHQPEHLRGAGAVELRQGLYQWLAEQASREGHGYDELVARLGIAADEETVIDEAGES